VVAVDGAAPRRSHDRSNGREALALVGASAGADRPTLGRAAVGEAPNEIVAIPALLRLLDLGGCAVAVDATGCRTKIAGETARRGAGYAPALEDNRASLREAAAVLFAEGGAAGPAGLSHDTHGTGHGRVERRRVRTVSDPAVIAYFDPGGARPGRRSVGAGEAGRRAGDRVSREARHDLSSLPGDAAASGRRPARPSAATGGSGTARAGSWTRPPAAYWLQPKGISDTGGLEQQEPYAVSQVPSLV